MAQACWPGLQSATGAESARRLALLGLGEIGRCTDLSAFPQLQQALTSALTSPSEQIKAAASLALGAVSIGNLDAYLPFVIQQINEQVGAGHPACYLTEALLRILRVADRGCMLQAANPKDQYLLLKALNEVIVSLTSDMGNKQLSPAHQQEVRTKACSKCFFPLSFTNRQ